MLETAFTFCCLIAVLLGVALTKRIPERVTLAYMVGIAVFLLALFVIVLLARSQW